MVKTKKEQGWQNVPDKGAYTLKESKVIADKPESLKKKEAEEKERKRLKRKEASEMYPWPAGYDGKKIRRTENGGLVRLKRK